jgi:hypothetical protein
MMNKERMSLLADLLDSLKPMKFDMGNWFSTYRGETIVPSNYGEDPEEHQHLPFVTNRVQKMNGYDCDSAACIAGWAVVLKNDFAVDRPHVETVEDHTDGQLYDNTVDSYAAHLPILLEACDYLGLTKEEGAALFTDDEHNRFWQENASDLGIDLDPDIGFDLSLVTPKIAAKAIRGVLSGDYELLCGRGGY